MVWGKSLLSSTPTLTNPQGTLPLQHLGGHLTRDDKENPNHHLEEEGDADEHDEGGIVLEGCALLQHSFELGDIGHEQGHVQHALCHALLGGVVVDVHRPVDPEVRIHALGRQEGSALLS